MILIILIITMLVCFLILIIPVIQMVLSFCILYFLIKKSSLPYFKIMIIDFDYHLDFINIWYIIEKKYQLNYPDGKSQIKNFVQFSPFGVLLTKHKLKSDIYKLDRTVPDEIKKKYKRDKILKNLNI